jgi:hypothetical protein
MFANLVSMTLKKLGLMLKLKDWKMRKMKIFISGPITGIENFNREAFDRAETMLTEQGHAVMNPIKLHPANPNSFSASDYLHICRAMIDCCDTIYFLKGYDRSFGALVEKGYASAQDKQMLFED